MANAFKRKVALSAKLRMQKSPGLVGVEAAEVSNVQSESTVLPIDNCSV